MSEQSSAAERRVTAQRARPCSGPRLIHHNTYSASRETDRERTEETVVVYLGGKALIAEALARAIISRTSRSSRLLETFIGGGSVHEWLALAAPKEDVMAFYVDMMMKEWSRDKMNSICREINADPSVNGGDRFLLLPRRTRRHLSRTPKRHGAQVRAIWLRSELRKMRDDLLAELDRRTT
jgi:hypothetical protein